MPPQTSLIPVSVALAKELLVRGVGAFPNWYLGTNFRLVSGPITPLLIALLSKMFDGNLFTAAYLVIVVGFVIATIGWGLFGYVVTKRKRIAVLIILVYAIAPWHYLSALILSDVPFVLARSLLPYLLTISWVVGKNKEWKWQVGLLVITTLIILVDSTIIPDIVICFLAVGLATSFRKSKAKFVGFSNRSRIYAINFAAAIAVSTVWYTPSYWINAFNNPSIGGASGINVISRIFEISRAFLPVIMGIGVVLLFHKVKSRFRILIVSWLLPFVALTVFRFISDYDFWADWTTWLAEVEIGLVLLSALLIYRKIYMPVVGGLIVVWLGVSVFYGMIGRPQLISRSYDLKQSISKLEELTSNGYGRVYLSGSSVFWANSLGDIEQVRGGADRGVSNRYWNMASYQIREGDLSSLTLKWLKILGVKYVLVHTEESSDYYHDFKNISKWENVGSSVWSNQGDVIYSIDSSIVWRTSSNADLSILPIDGKDEEALDTYLAQFVKPLNVTKTNKGYLIDTRDSKYVLIISALKMKIEDENGNNLGNISKDSYGNIRVENKTGSKFMSVEYQ